MTWPRPCRTSRGTPWRRTPRRLGPTRTASSTCRSVRRSTPRRPSSSGRSRPPLTRPGIRRPTARPTCARPWPAGSPVGAACRTSTRTASCRPSAARSWSRPCRRCSASAPGDVVVHPQVAYPTYDVGARLAGAEPVAADGTAQLGPLASRVRLLWLNSPGNPTGQVLGVEHLAKVVAWARQHGVVVASDECYAELSWGPADPEHPGPAGVRGQPRRSAGGLLAVQAVQPGRLPGRRSWPVTWRWCGGCWRCASTSA